MSEHELEKLLGGFAADTLTPEERQKLFTAALQDQSLFNTLADEQALKELLTDRVARRRLLDALHQTSPSRAGGSLAWFNWFRRPTGLALAGGLAAAVFAVVLGTKMYQESIERAAQSVATEEAKPAAPAPSASQPAPPSIAEQQAKTKDNAEATTKSPKKEAAPPSPRQDQQVAKNPRDRQTVQRGDQDELKQADAPVASLKKTAEDIPASADQNHRASGAPQAAPTEAKPMDVPATAPLAGVAAASSSARALFYEGGVSRADEPAMAREKGRARLEQKAERFAPAGKAAGSPARLKPLGLRYSFVVRETDGEDREVGAAALKHSTQARLTVEANQNAYLQILKTVGTAPSQRFYPRGGDRTSLPIAAGKRYEIPLPASAESESATLTVRVSREPLPEVERQEVGSAVGLSPDQFIESVTPGGASASQERATYIVNRNQTPTAQIVTEIPLGR